jgi:hypothetical protein
MSIADVTEPSASQSNVQWGPVLAGAAITTAFALILLTFGAALGLGFATPYEGEGLSPVAFAVAAGLYLLWVQVMSFYFGGYVAARLRARAPGASEHEVDVRDGLHGLLVWAVGVLAAAVIAFAGLSGAAVSANTRSERTDILTSVSQVTDQQVEQSAAEEAQETPQAAAASPDERRAEIARKFSVISAFITAASLLVGAVAAFIGAHAGGNHRDKNVIWEFFTSRERTRRL